jgi:hypothetical protein
MTNTNDPIYQSALHLSTRLGELAETFPTLPLHLQTAPSANLGTSRLAEILALFARRTAKEEAERNARTNDLLVGG